MLRWMFFIPHNNWKTLFLHKFSVTQRFGAIAMLLRSLKQVFWKGLVFFVRYPQSNTSMLLILKVQNQSSTFQIFLKIIFVDTTFFFINENFKTQKLSGGMFFIKGCNEFLWSVSFFTNCFKKVRTKTYDTYYINNDYTNAIKV